MTVPRIRTSAGWVDLVKPGPPGPEGPPGESGISAGKILYLAPSDASDIAGYKTLLESPSPAAEQTIATPCTGTGDVLVASFATDPGVPGAVDYPAGTVFRRIYAMVQAGTARLHLRVYKRDAAGVETLVRDEFSDNFVNQVVALQEWLAAAPAAGALTATDRLVAKLYAQRVGGPTTVTVTTFYEGSAHTSQIQTTISTGARGSAGPQGPAGPQGIQGPQGAAGTGVTMKGSVATVGNLPGSGNTQGDAYIVQADDSLHIWSGTAWVSGGSIQGPPGSQGPEGPQGDPGPQGIQGSQGPQGLVGPEGPAGDDGAAGPAGPAGAEGPQGPAGAAGAAGAAGQGVPVGGTTGQVLAKDTADDYDTEWIDPPAGGGGGVPAPTAWTSLAPDLLSPVGDIDAAWCKDGLGYILFRGRLYANSNISAKTVIFSLLAGNRPGKTAYLPVVTVNSTTLALTARAMEVDRDNWTVAFSGGINANDWICLDGLRYPTF